MSRSKGNDVVAADGAAFIEAFHRARKEFAKIDGVVSVGYGHKMVAGEFTYDICIHVFVREKKAESMLDDSQRIPGEFEGYRTDVRVVPTTSRATCTNSQRYATARGGMRIVPMPSGVAPTPATEYGTLGLIVRRRGNDGRDNWHLLSNEHVLFANGAKKGDRVYQPLPPIHPGESGRAIAVLGFPDTTSLNGYQKVEVPSGGYPTNADDAPPDRTVEVEFYVDCAIARIEVDSECCESLCSRDHVAFDTTIIDWKVANSPLDEPPQAADVNTARIAGVRSIVFDPSIFTLSGMPNPVPLEKQVFKVGAKTGKTMGIVRGVMTPVDETATIYKNVIEIEFAPTNTKPLNDCNHALFSEKGDSGSVIVDGHDRIVGLLFGSPLGNDKITHAAHILPVIKALDICIPNQRPLKKAYSYGCADAEDGSGTKRGPKIPSPPGFSFSGTAGAAPLRPGASTLAHFDDVREKLNNTDRGRRLLEALPDITREVGYLVRNVRPVMVTWHRARGPALLALVIAAMRGDSDRVPTIINGVTRAVLFARMRTALLAHGSPLLRRAIDEHGETIMALASAETVEECVVALRAREAAERSA